MPVFGHCSKSSHNPGLFWTTVLLDTNLEMISKKKCATIGFSFWIISQSIAKSKNSSNDQRISLRTLNMNHSSYCVFCAYNGRIPFTIVRLIAATWLPKISHVSRTLNELGPPNSTIRLCIHSKFNHSPAENRRFFWCWLPKQIRRW